MRKDKQVARLYQEIVALDLKTEIALEKDPQVQEIYEQIKNLTTRQTAFLLALLRDDEDSTSGVREPRRPPRPSSAGSVAIEIPEESPQHS